MTKDTKTVHKANTIFYNLQFPITIFFFLVYCKKYESIYGQFCNISHWH